MMIIMIRWENLFLCSDKTYEQDACYGQLHSQYCRPTPECFRCYYYVFITELLLWFVMVVIKIRGKRNDLNLLFSRYHLTNKPRRCCCSTLSLFGKYHYLRGFFFYCFDMDSIFKSHINGWLIRQAKPVKLKVSKRRVEIVLFYQKIMSRRGR